MNMKVMNMERSSTPGNMNMVMNVKFMKMNVRSMTRSTDLYAVLGAAWTKLVGCPVKTY